MEKRQKKILLLSIFGGGAVLVVFGYFAFLFWTFSLAFPQVTVRSMGSNFIELMKCQNQSHRLEADKNCVNAWVNSMRTKNSEETKKNNPEFDLCVYQQEILVEALSASKAYSPDDLTLKINQYCEYKPNLTNDILIESGHSDFKLIKKTIASQAVLNYRYKFFKKKNYILELEALASYRDVQDTKCADLETSMKDLEGKGSIFVLATMAICKISACLDAEQSTCPEAIKIAKRMTALGDIAGDFILMNEAFYLKKNKGKALPYASKALLNGYTDLVLEYPEIEDDFYKIKFDSDSLLFSAARLMSANKIYTPALNCVAASLTKDAEFDKLLKNPKTYSTKIWADKITSWANEDSELLLRVACEVLTDVESKKRLHNFYINEGNEDKSPFDFCTMIEDPLFIGACAERE